MSTFNMSLLLHFSKGKQHIDAFFKPDFVGICLFQEGLQVFSYIISWVIDEDLEADVSGDTEIDCIKS